MRTIVPAADSESQDFRAGLYNGRRYIARGGKRLAIERLGAEGAPKTIAEAEYIRGIEAAIKESRSSF